MQDRPSASELVAAVRDFLQEDVMRAVEGRVAFHTRVAVNALGMIVRELDDGARYEREEHARAVALLGHDGETHDLERELAARIRRGELTHADADVVAHLRATVRDKLRIANPGYLPPEEREATA
jgi:hypothetical protein